jgi:tRNA(Ile)-lysidine synthase
VVDQLKRYIQEKNLFTRHDRVLIAVSGGLDSMVLFHLMKQLEVEIAVAHCNFQLRGNESDQDEAFVREHGEKWRIPFFCKRFETNNYATENKISIQMAARELRYAWFDELMEGKGFTKLATAHHFNDSIETMILNWTRGGGIEGLRGIPAKRGNIIRPLLFATREEINNYAAEHAITWREDISNLTDDYQRNFIRHQVVPLLKRLNVSLEHTIRESAIRMEDEWAFYQKSVADWKALFLKMEGGVIKINKAGFVQPAHGASLLWQTIRSVGFSYHQCQDALEIRDHQPGKQFLSATHKLVVDRENFIVTQREDDWTEIIIHHVQHQVTLGPWVLEINVATEIKSSDSLSIAVVDADKLEFPLRWRKWKAGDMFFPLGMNHHKKISDFLIDRKISMGEKDSVTVLESAGEIVWVAGHRIDNRFKLTADTQNALAFSLRLR